MIMNNFYYIDKPLNYTSFDVIRILKKRFNIKRIWHTWTLDPLATWGLLIAVWNYTKLISYIEKETKEYEFDVMLDWITASYDLWEEVQFLSEKKQDLFKKSITKKGIQELLNNHFTWEIEQIPPKYSALKINWNRAYDLARKGKDFEMKKRNVTIFDIEILSFKYPKLSLKATVSAWTYIRSIASDLWELLWTGGYISKLRRTKIWKFDVKNACILDEISKDDSISVKDIFDKNLFISLDSDIIDKINNWLKVEAKFNFPLNQDLFVYCEGKITNIVSYDWEFLKAVRRI